MTQSDLNALLPALLAKWQPRLRLSDWDISITCQVGNNKDDEGAAIETAAHRLCACIDVPPDVVERYRSRVAVPPDTTDEHIVEAAVVHEMLHLVARTTVFNIAGEIEWLVGKESVVGLPLRTFWHDYQEQWINHLIRVLMLADQSHW